jgi:peptidoglycan/xylan/chitin deacetylase (PgdA/CDA1 family)
VLINLLYHDIVGPGATVDSGFPGADADLYKLGVLDFRSHLGAIAASGAMVSVDPDEVEDAGRVRVTLTFDDGGVSAYTHAADTVEEHGWRACFFVTAGFIGGRGFLSAAQIRELSRRGHVIGSHSISHPPRMSHCSPDQLRQEWEGSVSQLADILGQPVTWASVPGGYYSSSVASFAARAGIRILFNSEPVVSVRHVDTCRVYGRFAIVKTTPIETVSSLASAERWPRAQQFLSWNGKKVLKHLGGQSWLDFRRYVLARREAGR